jgi:o-succinylbenzoate synthase
VSAAILELRRRELRLEPPLVSARGSWTQRSTLELVLRDAEGQGRGEAAPLPDYSPDRIDACEHALEALEPGAFAAFDQTSPSTLLAAAALAIPAELPAARFALETALLDRASRRTGKPLWRLLAELIPGAAGSGPVALCALLPSADPALALELARRHVAAGVHAFKLKIGPDRLATAQLATLDALRCKLGGAIHLRLDANQSLSRAALGETLAQLVRYDIEFLEEPLADAAPEELADSPCPLALDESLQGLPVDSLSRLVERSRVRAIVLKPTALGGFDIAIRLALAARALGCAPVVSHTLEGPIGWAACAHLALALQGRRAAGLSPLAHQRTDSPHIVRGELLPPTQPGLGADA